ncbi:cell growth-regulating nucleolar protein isoform X2 [Halyomorpha halys]|uniref:cell growth-regulating nucleolar protein isoform X2 n=1 Tax=Halyomorpha halys TaxID=286706 RepID=UPI0006D4ED1A|nr:cell growth-regulating nucleolar protein isoform X2 [Halyomorpha halys]
MTDGDDYNSHMTCVTEDERYGDKNFVAKKVGVKQTEWIDIVHLCAEQNKNPKFKFIFSKLATYQNVPRKKPKFLNFIKSSLPKFSQDIALEVFQVIDEQFLKQKKKDSQDENGISKSEKNADETLSDVKEVTDKSEGMKKKKKKRNRNSESEVPSAENVDINDPAEEKSNKKKKKSKNVDNSSPVESNESSEKMEENKNGFTDNQNGIGDHEEVNETDNHEKLSKKELKKLKKKQKYDALLKNIEESESAMDMDNENEGNNQNSIKPSKKQKKRKATTSESEPCTEKRQKVEGNEESENIADEEEEKAQKGKARFNWEETIKELLRKNPDHEMPLKRISKKVLAEYQAVKGDRESYETLISKFNKKINKTVGVRVLKDRAKLISDD